MIQRPLFYESLNAALQTVVRIMGGFKKIGTLFFPEKEPDEAGRLLSHSLDDNRKEKLSDRQLILLLAEARKAGVHDGFYYICDRTGYKRPEPITAEDRVSALTERISTLKSEIRDLSRLLEDFDDETNVVSIRK